MGSVYRKEVDGYIEFFNERGFLHRDFDRPAVEYADGSKWWWVNDKLHRLDGPAIERVTGDKVWYVDDKPHRLDGPAIERVNGDKSWCINGKYYTEEEFLIKRQPKEMTMEELEKQLGYSIKIVK